MPPRIAGKYLQSIKIGHTPQVFVGSMPMPNRVNPAVNNPRRNKPSGGIWTSSYTNNDHISDWYDFQRYDPESVPPSWLLTPKDDIKILQMERGIIRDLPKVENVGAGIIDYEALANNGIDAIHYPYSILDHPLLRHVDVESTAWISNRWPFSNARQLTPAGPTWKSRFSKVSQPRVEKVVSGQVNPDWLKVQQMVEDDW